jgi:hypothetical protein
MYKKLFFIFIQCAIVSLWAQEIPIGQFKEYLPYNRFHCIAQDGENIYAATNQSVLVVDKADGTKVKWSNLNGLSNVGVQTIHSDQKGRLIIAYTNSNIDVIKDYKVNNIRDILNKQITGSKNINHISTIDDFSYFACDFGVVVLDLKTLLIKDTWFTLRNNEPYIARCITIHNQRYYLATNRGVFSLSITASNPADFSMWTQENELPKSSFKLLCSYQDKLYAVWDGNTNLDSLFVYHNEHWKYNDKLQIRSFEVKDDKMLVCSWNYVRVYTGNSFTMYVWEPRSPVAWQNGQMATFDEKMDIWVADNGSGVIHINTATKEFETIIAEGPANSNAYGLCFMDGLLAVVPGARSNPIIPDWTAPAISILKDDHWWSHSDFSQFYLATGFNSVVFNPLNNNEIYIASWQGGLIKVNCVTGEIVQYNQDNSPMKPSSTRLHGEVFLSGLAIDRQNYLWMLQTEALNLLHVKDLNAKDDTTWYTFNLSPFVSSSALLRAEQILIDSRNYKWVTIPVQNKLIVFFENGSLTNSAVHKKAEVNLKDQANVAGNRITCIAEDREGYIWIGADQGIKVLNDAGAAFTKTLYARNILLEQIIGDTAYTQNLLEFEYVTCIAVDAANRKWIGTRNAGVFFVSPNGTQELFHFTTENSPLFSNQINDIKINPENGEVFFATEGGLISYKGTATISQENYKETLVYPNPVRENYYGPIAVKGLMEDSFCKITDAAGKLVWQGYAYGGQLIWNGKDFYGKRPATGVYFVMASSKTGKEKKVAKFLFIQ